MDNRNLLQKIMTAFIVAYTSALLVLLFLIGNLGYIIAKAPDLKKITNITADTVAFDYVPAYISAAFLAAEDIRYYERPGMETRAVLKSLIRSAINKKELKVEITVVQKLVPYAFNKPEDSFARDLQEAYLAFILENTYNRKQILQMYINNASFGANIYGLSAASYYYFGKRPQDISISEAALLAAILKDPESLSRNLNLHKAYTARDTILSTMQKNGLIGRQAFYTAQKEAIKLHKSLDQPAKAFDID